MTRRILALLLCVASGALAQQPSGTAGAGGAGRAGRPSKAKPAGRISLTPRFSPGQTFHYHMVFETDTAVTQNGLAKDPQGPSTVAVVWDATMRFEVLPAPSANGGVALRLVYEKSSADVHSDAFDPDAAAMQDQYQKLQGKTLEFAFDPAGKLTGVTGLEGVVDNEAALQSARQWITQFVAGPGAPAAGVTVGQKWFSDEPADNLPIAGIAWRAASEYIRDEPCPAGVSDAQAAADARPAGGSSTPSGEMCAVIVTDLTLVQAKSLSDQTPEALRKSQIHTAGTWDGSAHSQSYISLRTGLVASITQTGSESMDVTFTTEHLENLHYSGKITSRSQITLEPAAPAQ